jgi:hypothetical protein
VTERGPCRGTRTTAIGAFAALLALAAYPVHAQGFDRSVDDNCSVILPPDGGDQVLTTSEPIPAGKTILIDLVYNHTLVLQGATDDAGNTYDIAETDTDQSFDVTAMVGDIQTPLGAGQHITLSYLTGVLRGTACALAYRVDGISGGYLGSDVSNSSFGTGSLARVSIFDTQLSAPGEFMQLVFYAQPLVGDVTGTINLPLVEQSSVCTTTINNRMCRLSAYGVLPTADAFTASLSLSGSVSWGAVFVTYLLAPEPSAGALELGALAALTVLARSRRDR